MPVKKIDKISAKVLKYLEKTGIKHDILEHKTVYTAIDAAKTLKKELNEIAKSLLIKADKDYYLVLLPSDHNLDADKLKKVIEKGGDKQVKSIKIPGEKVMEKTLKIKAGALTAFGSLYNIPVIVDKKLEKVRKAVFASGSLNQSVEIAVKDFIKMEDALLDNFGIKKKIKVDKKVKTKKSVKKSPAKKKPVKKAVSKKKSAAKAKKKVTAAKKKK